MTASTKTLRAHLTLESLESRLAPTSSVNARGDLVIHSGAGTDVVTVRHVSGNTFRVVENGRVSDHRVTGGDVVFYGGAGNDRFTNYTALRSIAYGEAGNDFLYGGTNNDYLHGGYGNDVMYGYGGRDTLVGGPGYDTGYGGLGADYLYQIERGSI